MSFKPPFYLKNPLLQTALNSFHGRNRGITDFEKKSIEKQVATSQGTVLQYYETIHDDARGVVLLLHGWEGSSHSAYIVNTGRYFYARGYSVVRLNLRDHGTSHGLNEGLFYGTLLDETFDAVKRIASCFGDRKFFVAGFSMGANFTLRIAARASKEPIKNLHHLFAVNAPLDPAQATDLIDSQRFLRKYFIGKWKKSLVLKQMLYPEIYHVDDILKMKSCMAMTDALVTRYSDYSSAEEYFNGYTIGTDYLKDVTVPLTILMSKDDPVIPWHDFSQLNLSKSVELLLEDHGGHCGYLQDALLTPWYQVVMDERFLGKS